MNELENLKKRLLYRSNYRGTKELDILLSSFVISCIDKLNLEELNELETFLNFDDEIIYAFYQKGILNAGIEKNKMSKIFKEFKIK
jgi:antitoxin CptB